MDWQGDMITAITPLGPEGSGRYKSRGEVREEGNYKGNSPGMNTLRGRISKVGVPNLLLEVEMSLIYTKLPENILEHSISFHPVPSCSNTFQHVPWCDLALVL